MTALLVRAAERAEALERLLGLVRRRAMKLRPAGIAREGADGGWIVLLVPTAPDPPLERYAHDIRGLVDVREVRTLQDGEAAVRREMAVVRVSPLPDRPVEGNGRALQVAGGGVTLELTGTSEEIDAVLAGLSARGVLTAFVRTGETVVSIAELNHGGGRP